MEGAGKRKNAFQQLTGRCQLSAGSRKLNLTLADQLHDNDPSHCLPGAQHPDTVCIYQPAFQLLPRRGGGGWKWLLSRPKLWSLLSAIQLPDRFGCPVIFVLFRLDFAMGRVRNSSSRGFLLVRALHSLSLTDGWDIWRGRGAQVMEPHELEYKKLTRYYTN